MNAKSKSFGGVVIAIITGLAGAVFVVRGLMSLLHQAAIYAKVPASIIPWQALIFGAIWLALGLLLMAQALHHWRSAGKVAK